MQVADVQSFVVDNPPPGKGGRYFLFVKVTTDGGVTGWGEAYGATFGPQVMEAAIA
ncbi:MAG: mandelate racemase/muconate lactonizing enzyme family protein, partial [Actinomycetia bacterium]|nr:mandelate racemase/muconate lactonizing enzyme family protein [Actinomycetes bacterium]